MWRFQPSPPWGRGWTAAGAFTSRSGTGEGVSCAVQYHCGLSGGATPRSALDSPDERDGWGVSSAVQYHCGLSGGATPRLALSSPDERLGKLAAADPQTEGFVHGQSSSRRQSGFRSWAAAETAPRWWRKEATPHPSRDGWRRRRRGTPSPQGEGYASRVGSARNKE